METRSRKRQAAKGGRGVHRLWKAIPHRAIVSGLSQRLACEDDAVPELAGQTHRQKSCRGFADWQPTIELASPGQLGLAGPSKIFRCLHVCRENHTSQLSIRPRTRRPSGRCGWMEQQRQPRELRPRSHAARRDAQEISGFPITPGTRRSSKTTRGAVSFCKSKSLFGSGQGSGIEMNPAHPCKERPNLAQAVNRGGGATWRFCGTALCFVCVFFSSYLRVAGFWT